MDPYLHYDLLNRKHRALALKSIIQERIKPGMRVLDAGCGSGLLSIWAGQCGAQVVGVDMADTSLAEALVQENDLASRVRIMRGDLFKVDLGGERFDALLAMVYLNDPRRDEDRPGLIHGLKRFLKPDALMVPDCVRYTATPLEWPAQRTPSRWSRLDNGIAELESAYGMRMQTFKGLLRVRPNKSLFPLRGMDGLIQMDGARRLGASCEVSVQHLQHTPAKFPNQVELAIAENGEFNVLLWEQELLFEGRLIFRNQSIGWVDPPREVQSGSPVAVALDDRWRQDNLMTAY